MVLDPPQVVTSYITVTLTSVTFEQIVLLEVVLQHHSFKFYQSNDMKRR